jgi:hypothetical protein
MPRGVNFHPEWGCLAPAPTLMRTMRVALVATAVGATVGGGVVLSLAGHSADQMSVGERTLVRPVPAASTAIRTPETLSQRESAEVSLDDDAVDAAAPNALSPSSPVHRAVVAPLAERSASTAKTVAAPSRAQKHSTYVVQRARHKDLGSSRQTQHLGAPQTPPNVVDRFFTGLTAAIEHVWPSQRVPTNRTSRAHDADPANLS